MTPIILITVQPIPIAQSTRPAPLELQAVDHRTIACPILGPWSGKSWGREREILEKH
jgi:hypothetical protein